MGWKVNWYFSKLATTLGIISPLLQTLLPDTNAPVTVVFWILHNTMEHAAYNFYPSFLSKILINFSILDWADSMFVLINRKDHPSLMYWADSENSWIPVWLQVLTFVLKFPMFCTYSYKIFWWSWKKDLPCLL